MQSIELDNDLDVGAAAIAQNSFGGKVSTRQVYRLAEEGGWPIFTLRGKLAARPSSIRAEIRRREQAAVGAAA